MVLIGPNTASALLLVAIMAAIVVWICWDQIKPKLTRLPRPAVLADNAVMSNNADDDTEIADTTSTEPIPENPAPASERDIIIALARLKGDDGKYRYSANEIAKFIKMQRNDVLDIIRPERAGEAVLPDTYQQNAMPRRSEIVEVLPDGKPVREDQWGNRFVLDGNQEIPVDLYVTSAV